MIMDCRTLFLIVLVTLLALIVRVEGRTKKVVIHVPYEVKKIKHTHTVFRTVHHHHIDHGNKPPVEHEHFHHLHLHELREDPKSGQHSQPVPGVGIPEFLPDVSLEVPLKIPVDLPTHEIPGLPNKLSIPLYRRSSDNQRQGRPGNI